MLAQSPRNEQKAVQTATYQGNSKQEGILYIIRDTEKLLHPSERTKCPVTTELYPREDKGSSLVRARVSRHEDKASSTRGQIAGAVRAKRYVKIYCCQTIRYSSTPRLPDYARGEPGTFFYI